MISKLVRFIFIVKPFLIGRMICYHRDILDREMVLETNGFVFISGRIEQNIIKHVGLDQKVVIQVLNKVGSSKKL